MPAAGDRFGQGFDEKAYFAGDSSVCSKLSERICGGPPAGTGSASAGCLCACASAIPLDRILRRINGGYGWGTLKTDDGMGNTPTLNSNGGIVGGTFGFNYQINQFVVGFEGDVDWSGMQFNQSGATSSFFGAGAASLTYKNDILSTFGARFGFAADRLLLYAKGGGAWTDEDYNMTGTDPV